MEGVGVEGFLPKLSLSRRAAIRTRVDFGGGTGKCAILVNQETGKYPTRSKQGTQRETNIGRVAEKTTAFTSSFVGRVRQKPVEGNQTV